MAFGMGFGMSQRTNIVASAVPIEEIGAASSVLALARNIAGAFGIALFSTILQDSTYSFMARITKNSVLNSLPTSQNIITFVKLMAIKAQVMAYDRVFLISSIVLTLGAITAYWIRVDKEVEAEVFVE
jgi:hypothetical protein